MKLVKMMSIFVFLFCIAAGQSNGQDTIQISGKDINTKVLREGTHCYLVYFKMKKDAPLMQTQFWTRTIKRTDYNGTPAIEITQEWEDKDSIMYIVKSISDSKAILSLYHKTKC